MWLWIQSLYNVSIISLNFSAIIDSSLRKWTLIILFINITPIIVIITIKRLPLLCIKFLFTFNVFIFFLLLTHQLVLSIYHGVVVLYRRVFHHYQVSVVVKCYCLITQTQLVKDTVLFIIRVVTVCIGVSDFYWFNWRLTFHLQCHIFMFDLLLHIFLLKRLLLPMFLIHLHLGPQFTDFKIHLIHFLTLLFLFFCSLFQCDLRLIVIKLFWSIMYIFENFPAYIVPHRIRSYTQGTSLHTTVQGILVKQI